MTLFKRGRTNYFYVGFDNDTLANGDVLEKEDLPRYVAKNKLDMVIYAVRAKGKKSTLLNALREMDEKYGEALIFEWWKIIPVSYMYFLHTDKKYEIYAIPKNTISDLDLDRFFINDKQYSKESIMNMFPDIDYMKSREEEYEKKLKQEEVEIVSPKLEQNEKILSTNVNIQNNTTVFVIGGEDRGESYLRIIREQNDKEEEINQWASVLGVPNVPSGNSGGMLKYLIPIAGLGILAMKK